MRRVIGVDCDGTICDWNSAFAKLLVEVSGEDKLGSDFTPTCWHWPEEMGYAPEQVADTWEHVYTDPIFWANLHELPGAKELREADRLWDANIELYFLTNRAGINVKDQTESWLIRHLAYDLPTVLISEHKGPLCAALGIEAYIDDKVENVRSVMRSPCTRAYLLDQPWNQDPAERMGMTVVGSVKEFLTAEGLD